jgi:hypothetical protein
MKWSWRRDRARRKRVRFVNVRVGRVECAEMQQFDHSLRPGAAATYRLMQQARVRILLTRLLATPDQWRAHIELCEIVSVFTMICVTVGWP